ncbi:MAG: WD40 repeat domain-containing protein [Candidatus Poribacteria bacterium]|nr:WD40 repeat domain-containing protein [Candidatus Poribacteria bacterium]
MQNSENWSPAFTQHNNNDITTWELPGGAMARLGQGNLMGNVAFSPDATCFVMPTTIGLWWYNLSTMNPIALSDTDRGIITAASFSPNGQWLATGDGDGIVKVWNVESSVCVDQMERDETEKPYHLVSRLVFSDDSLYLAASSRRDYILYIWNPETGERVAKFHEETNFRWSRGTERPIAFSADGSLLACTMPDDSLFASVDYQGRIRSSDHSFHKIAVWNMKTGERIACLTEHTDFVYSLSFSPCGQFLASGGQDGTVRIWKVINWELANAFHNYGADRKQVFYSPEGVLYAAGASESTVSVWNVASGEKSYTYQDEHHSIHGIHVSNQNQLAFITVERELLTGFKTLSLKTSQVRTVNYTHIGTPDSLLISPDGKILFSVCRGKGIMLWDIDNLSRPPTRFNTHGNHAKSVTVSPDGKLQAIVPDGITVKVWENRNAEMPITSFTLPEQKDTLHEQERQVTVVAFAPTRSLLACGDNDGMLYVWDVQQQYIRHAIKAYDGWIHSVVFSPNEKLLVSIRQDGPISRLWNVESGEDIETFPNANVSVAFSPNSNLIACGMRQKILLWDVERNEIIMTLPHAQDSWWPNALAFSQCGQYLASGSSWERDIGMKRVPIRLWNVESGENIAIFRGHPTDVHALTFSPDGTLLASGSYDGTILLWDMKPYIGS